MHCVCSFCVYILCLFHRSRRHRYCYWYFRRWIETRIQIFNKSVKKSVGACFDQTHASSRLTPFQKIHWPIWWSFLTSLVEVPSWSLVGCLMLDFWIAISKNLYESVLAESECNYYTSKVCESLFTGLFVASFHPI